jgi:uncharacterized membrane protein YphA (DoxX/SURF4 family)
VENDRPQSEPNLPVWVLVLRVLLGLFFLYSGGIKIFVVGLSDFVDAVGNYQIVGAPWDAVVGYVLPWIEIASGLALVTGVASRGAALIVIGMILFFNGALALAWSSGLEINCGCHGQSDDPTNYLVKILQNFGLLVVALVTLVSEFRIFGPHSDPDDALLPTT